MVIVVYVECHQFIGASFICVGGVLGEELLVHVFSDWHIPSVDFSMTYHKDKFRPECLIKLIVFITDKFKQMRKT
ncbi:hypothetical protein VEZ01S_21_00850 [Vibrio ezurae NBRC 102218]|uniref:Uncharacterized protein n=1 Tax=Vibrio ezurae NBRC 102218 TaxID=1219080 RepID=U3AJ66_9VIBR|nr:hypothetical protein VEZ01S_21_00850 [Vibrio ezurae NBRC 102218]